MGLHIKVTNRAFNRPTELEPQRYGAWVTGGCDTQPGVRAVLPEKISTQALTSQEVYVKKVF